jgi:hypothetical protein
MSRVPTSLPTPGHGACALPISASRAAQSHTRLRVPDTTRSTSTPGFRCRKAPTPSGAAVGRRSHQLRPNPSSRDEVACAGAGKRPERACSATREPDGWAADVPCHTAARPTRGRDGATAPRTNPLTVRQHRAVVSPERLPSMNPRSARRLIQPTSSSEPPLLLWLRRRCAASNTRSRTRCVR